jgi:signal transduction histidine kinase
VRLSQFILTHPEKILSEWEAFARSIVPSGMDIAALRDHAREMLEVIARDLETPQTLREGSDKSKGRSDADPDPSTPDTPAQAHGSGRAESGFTFEQMVSEYRAMRASVIRLWTAETGELKGADIEDLIRFSEAIDQALAESTSRFTADLDYTKETFLGILGHDLRTPLGAIVTSAQFMLEMTELKPAAACA